MTTLTISLPEPLREFVESQVAEGRYKSADEYVRALLYEAQQAKARTSLEGLLSEGPEGRVTSDAERQQRLEELRRAIGVGLEDLRRGDSLPADEVFRQLRERNRKASGQPE